jgi:hypothetical protein
LLGRVVQIKLPDLYANGNGTQPLVDVTTPLQA